MQQLWTNALDSGTQSSIHIEDDNSTTIAKILNKVPYKVEKWSDTIHTKHSLTPCLNKLKDRFKNPNCSTLSNKVTSYYAKCFSYAVTQNPYNRNQLHSTKVHLIHHGVVSKNGLSYQHTKLPNDKRLHGESMKSALTSFLNMPLIFLSRSFVHVPTLNWMKVYQI